MLLHRINASFPEPMIESVFIDLFQVSVAEVSMQSEACLSNLITKLEYFVLHIGIFCAFCAFLRLQRIVFSRAHEAVEYQRNYSPYFSNLR